MKTPAYRSSITDAPNDDSNVLFGGTGINILVGSTGSDTVDYSIL